MNIYSVRELCLCCVVLFFTHFLLFSQKEHCVTYKILYAEGKKPAFGALVKVYDASDSILYYNRLGVDGIFKRCDFPKRYSLSIKGMTVRDTLVNVTESDNYKFRDIYVKRKIFDLDGIILESKKNTRDTVKYELDSLKYNKTESLSDILKTLPGFEVKNEREIYHKGQLIEHLLIDGKDFLSSHKKQVLENFKKEHLKSLSVYENYKSPFKNYSVIEKGKKALDLKSSKNFRGRSDLSGELWGGYRNKLFAKTNFMSLKKNSFLMFNYIFSNINKSSHFEKGNPKTLFSYGDYNSMFSSPLIGADNRLNFGNVLYAYQDDKNYLKIDFHQKSAVNRYKDNTLVNDVYGSYLIDRSVKKEAHNLYASADFKKKMKWGVFRYKFSNNYLPSGRDNGYTFNSDNINNKYHHKAKEHELYNRFSIDKALSDSDIILSEVKSTLKKYKNEDFIRSNENYSGSNLDYGENYFEWLIRYKKTHKKFLLSTYLQYKSNNQNVINFLNQTQTLHFNFKDYKIGGYTRFLIWRLKNDVSMYIQRNNINGNISNTVFPFSWESTFSVSLKTNLRVGFSRSYSNIASYYAISGRRVTQDVYNIGNPKISNYLTLSQIGFVSFSFLDNTKGGYSNISINYNFKDQAPSYNTSVDKNTFLRKVFISDLYEKSASMVHNYRICKYRKIQFSASIYSALSEYDFIDNKSGKRLYLMRSVNASPSCKVEYFLREDRQLIFEPKLNYALSKTFYADTKTTQSNLNQYMELSYKSKKVLGKISYVLNRYYFDGKSITNFKNLNLTATVTLGNNLYLNVEGANVLSLFENRSITTTQSVGNSQKVSSTPIFSYLIIGLKLDNLF